MPKSKFNEDQLEIIRSMTKNMLEEDYSLAEIVTELNNEEIPVNYKDVWNTANWLKENPNFESVIETEVIDSQEDEDVQEEESEDATKKLVKFILDRTYLEDNQKIQLIQDFCEL